MKKFLSIVLTAIALTACSGGLDEAEIRVIVDEAVATAVAGQESSVTGDLPSVISVREIELRDDEGRLRGRLGVNSVGNSELALFDGQSDLFPRWTSSVGEDGETLLTFWRTNGEQLGVGLQLTENGVGLVDANGVIRLALALSEAKGNSPLIGMRNSAGAVTVGIAESGLSVRDGDGNLLFTAPDNP
ncbi:MAG: hypothetical protein HQ478_06620 [Chloroflexi bacterium]|nr:hypothetical protein [Chloroflexota bacterium]